MTQENSNWITAIEGDTAIFHCYLRTPKGNQYIDLKVDEKGNVEITKNYKSWDK